MTLGTCEKMLEKGKKSLSGIFYEMSMKLPFLRCQDFAGALPQGRRPIGLH